MRRGDALDPPGEMANLARFYDLGKANAWNASDVAWDAPLVPGRQLTERRRELWRSVVTQQYQADVGAVQMAAQLIAMAPEPSARLYYTVMAQDEARHVEVWTRLAELLGGPGELDPHLAELLAMGVEVDDLTLKLVPMQVFFEGMALDAFHEIAASAVGTVMGEVCGRLAKDDALHHGFGFAYAKVRLETASPALRRALDDQMSHYWRVYQAHLLWRPEARRWLGGPMQAADREKVQRRAAFVVRMRDALGLGFDVEM